LLARPLPKYGKGLFVFFREKAGKSLYRQTVKAFLFFEQDDGTRCKRGGRNLRKKHNLVELVKSNKEQLLNDKKQLEKIEKRIEERRSLVSKKGGI